LMNDKAKGLKSIENYCKRYGRCHVVVLGPREFSRPIFHLSGLPKNIQKCYEHVLTQFKEKYKFDVSNLEILVPNDSDLTNISTRCQIKEPTNEESKIVPGFRRIELIGEKISDLASTLANLFQLYNKRIEFR